MINIVKTTLQGRCALLNAFPGLFLAVMREIVRRLEGRKASLHVAVYVLTAAGGGVSEV